MSDERGSLTVLGLFTVISLLIFTTVLLNATSMYLQQRQLSSLSDALALDLADYLQESTSSATVEIARSELELLNATERGTELVHLIIESPKVSVRLCQTADLAFLDLNVGIESIRVCASSVATSF